MGIFDLFKKDRIEKQEVGNNTTNPVCEKAETETGFVVMNEKVEKLLNEYIEIVMSRKQIEATDFVEKGSVTKYNKLMDKLIKIAIKIEENYPEDKDAFCNLLLHSDLDVRKAVAGRILNNDYPMKWQEKAAQEYREYMQECAPHEKMMIESVLDEWQLNYRTGYAEGFGKGLPKTNDINWGAPVDNGFKHVKKIVNYDLQIDKLAGFNHLAIFLRWAAKHDLLNEEISVISPNLKQQLVNNEIDIRRLIAEYEDFNGKLMLKHFNDAGRSFVCHYYTFSYNGFAHDVDRYAERFFGTKKYNCKEYKNEAYLFVPFDEEYYLGLSQYIDKAFEAFCEEEKTTKVEITSDVKKELENIKNTLAKPAVIFKTGGKRPTKELLESWIGRVGWKHVGEEIPKNCAGEPMVPFMTLFIKELPYVPEVIKHVELLTVFLSVETLEEAVLEDGDFHIRTYSSLDNLQPCDWYTDYVKAFPLTPKLITDDYPAWDSEDIPETLRKRILELERNEGINYFDDIIGDDECYHKIGGYPSYIQSGIVLEGYEFVFQITYDDKANFCFGDAGNIYFFYNKDENRWRVHYDYY